MDERKLEALFQDAARAAPPASFDEHDVARASRRVTARRRVAGTGGAVVAAAVLVGGVGLSTGAFDQGSTLADDPASRSEPQAPARPGTLEGPAQPQVGQPQVGQPQTGQTQGSPDQSKAGPGVMTLPGGSAGCASPDPSLAGALSERVPETRGVAPSPASGECPSGSRAAEFHFRQSRASGTLTVRVSPVGSVPPEQLSPGQSRGPNGAELATARTHSGKVLVVRSQPDAGSTPPYAGQLTSIASGLAGQV